jgi:hypothetical protein
LFKTRVAAVNPLNSMLFNPIAYTNIHYLGVKIKAYVAYETLRMGGL